MNVNPGFRNPKRLLNQRGYHLSIRLALFWGYPTIFINHGVRVDIAGIQAIIRTSTSQSCTSLGSRDRTRTEQTATQGVVCTLYRALRYQKQTKKTSWRIGVLEQSMAVSASLWDCYPENGRLTLTDFKYKEKLRDMIRDIFSQSNDVRLPKHEVTKTASKEFRRMCFVNPFWLVVGPPLWKIWKSIGMISNPIYGKIKNVPNHQPALNLAVAWFQTNPRVSKNHVRLIFVSMSLEFLRRAKGSLWGALSSQSPLLRNLGQNP